MELFTSANPKHTLLSDVILRRTTSIQPILHLSAATMRPGSFVLYKSLTYLKIVMLTTC